MIEIARLLKKLRTEIDEIYWSDGALSKDHAIRFWSRSGYRFGYRNFLEDTMSELA